MSRFEFHLRTVDDRYELADLDGHDLPRIETGLRRFFVIGDEGVLADS